MTALQLGYSFCPNDTFIFYALTHGKIASQFAIEELLEDVQTLNGYALEGRLPMTKISYAAYAHVAHQYVALRAGGALGHGVGPLLVAKHPKMFEGGYAGKRIGIPGRHTTAYLLMRLYAQGFEPIELRYDHIMPQVLSGELDAGLIIHESRFTYQQHGLQACVDLGAWWESQTGLPLPLGAILAKRSLGQAALEQLNTMVRQSLEYAYANPQEPLAYIRQHAAELSDEVIWQHIHTYVNPMSLDVTDVGERAVQELFRRATAAGLIPAVSQPLFVG